MDTDDYDRSEHTREVYARFGLALYYAQVLEHGIVDSLALIQLLPRRGRDIRTLEQWAALFDQFMTEKFNKTMGRLLREFGEVADVAPDFETVLAEALQRRNFLAHHFFREYSDASITRAGKDRMIEYVDECRGIFIEADRRVENMIAPIRQRAGITEEMIQKELARMKREAELAA